MVATRTIFVSRSRIALLSILCVFTCTFFLVVPTLGPGGSASGATCPAGASLTVDAHPDDDLFFQNPDVLHEITSGSCLRTVYVTSGDNGEGTSYWQSREAGIQAAYAQMAGTADTWTTATQTFAGHRVTVRTLSAHPQVSIAFLRLPDGNIDGQGSSRYPGISLQRLYGGSISSMSTVDGSGTYTKDGLVQVLGALMTADSAGVVRTLDFEGTYGDGDHSDHHTVAYFARTAQQQYAPGSRLVGYRGYPVVDLPANVSGDDYERKYAAYLTYAPHDHNECQTRAVCDSRYEGSWLQRQYTVGSTSPTSTATPTVTATPTATSSPTASGGVSTWRGRRRRRPRARRRGRVRRRRSTGWWTATRGTTPRSGPRCRVARGAGCA